MTTKKPKRPDDGLNPKQARFVAEYLIDPNATQAAIRAGYSKKTAHVQGCMLLKHPKVAARLAERQKSAAEKLGITAERVLAEYARIAFVDIAQAYDAAGNLLNVTAMPEDVRRALAAFDLEVKSDGDGYAHVRKVKLIPKTTALDALGRHLKLFHDAKIDLADLGEAFARQYEAGIAAAQARGKK